MTTYADLDALAANFEAGTLWRHGAYWTYPGAPAPLAGQAMPSGAVPDGRVQAAIVSGDYVPVVLDGGVAVAVIAKPADGSTILARQLADAGSYKAAPSFKGGPIPGVNSTVPLFSTADDVEATAANDRLTADRG